MKFEEQFEEFDEFEVEFEEFVQVEFLVNRPNYCLTDRLLTEYSRRKVYVSYCPTDRHRRWRPDTTMRRRR